MGFLSKVLKCRAGWVKHIARMPEYRLPKIVSIIMLVRSRLSKGGSQVEMGGYAAVRYVR